MRVEDVPVSSATLFRAKSTRTARSDIFMRDAFARESIERNSAARAAVSISPLLTLVEFDSAVAFTQHLSEE